ncbi:hypothetical protein GCM10022389_06090 [Flavobacterium cheonanense]|uniref:Uncharacterized protein n=1 Tax=Flavobacterium cheonanense TaxID=706183 RepID=A0ABP7VC60_9FLAO
MIKISFIFKKGTNYFIRCNRNKYPKLKNINTKKNKVRKPKFKFFHSKLIILLQPIFLICCHGFAIRAQIPNQNKSNKLIT